MARRTGMFALVLHAHLPFVVGHGRWPHGEAWLYEAASECYLPLLRVLDGLVADGISPQVTIGITPVLAEMLDSDRFRAGFVSYLDDRADRASADASRFGSSNARELAALAHSAKDRLASLRAEFQETYGRDIVGAFRRFQDEGHIEILTSAATHGYLPLLGHDDHVAAQLRAGVAHYRRRFGRPPRGVWLPECAYRPRGAWDRPGAKGARIRRRGIEEFLLALGLRYFLVDTHLVRGGVPVGTYSLRAPILPPPVARPAREIPSRSLLEPYRLRGGSGSRRVAVFGRHPRLGLQVWSADYGYPGDGSYLEFHRKEPESGLRYWRITDRSLALDRKEVYDPRAAAGRVEDHANHFVGIVREVLSEHRGATRRAGVAVAPFDAELLGHWWSEGPMWLDRVLRLLARSGDMELATCSRALRRCPPQATVQLPEGSWGLGGHHWTWANPDTMWTWDRVYGAEDRYRDLLGRARRRSDPIMRRVLAQLGREVLLLESSDWQFLITTWSARDYASSRVDAHAAAADRLAGLAERLLRGDPPDPADAKFLEETEARDFVFPDLDPAWWSPIER